MGSPSLPPDAFDGSPGPYGTDPDQEFLAGYLDGARAGRVAIFDVARSELARFRIAVDDEGIIKRVDSPPRFERRAPLEPDNPLNDEDYAEGWQRGFEETQESFIDHLRPQLVDDRLFLANDGSVATYDTASDLVSLFRNMVRSTGGVDLTDAAIHAFLDESAPDTAAPSTPSTAIPTEPDPPKGGPRRVATHTPLEPETESTDLPPPIPANSHPADAGSHAADDETSLPAELAPDQVLVSHSEPEPLIPERHVSAPQGAMLVPFAPIDQQAQTASRFRIDRRTVFAALSGALVTATASAAFYFSRPKEKLQTQAPAGSWTPPTHWDHLTSPIRDIYLSIDHFIWSMEQSPLGAAQATTLVSQIMATPGLDPLKEYVVGYVGDALKAPYVTSILEGLHPARSARNVRRLIIVAIQDLWRAHGTQAVTSSMRATLEQYLASGVETDQGAINALNRLITKLTAAGL